ncbi:hypothetical protein ACHAWF_000032 [Thalassiosira exigua]
MCDEDNQYDLSEERAKVWVSSKLTSARK